MSDPQEDRFIAERDVDLSDAEQMFVAQAGDGGVIDLSGQTVAGAIVREVACGSGHIGVRDGRNTGLTIRNGVISGGLDLEGCTLARPLVIENSRIEGDGQGCALRLRDARIKRIAVRSTVIDGAIEADRVHVDSGMFLFNCEVHGAVHVAGGAVGGNLSLEETQFGDGGRGLVADGLRVRGALVLISSKVDGFVSMARARLDGGVCANDAEIDGRGAEWGFDATGAHLGGDFLLERAQINGALCVAHCEIGGRLVIDGASVVSGRDIAIGGFGVNVAHGISAHRAIMRGAVILRSAQISKGMSSPGLEVSGGETAIDGDGIILGGNWDLAGAKLVGDFSLAGARIEGQLKLTEARLFGSEVAMRADGARIGGGCFLSRAIVIGCLRFPATQIGNQFRLRGASLKVDYGAALFASGSVFSRDVELNGGMVSAGALVFDQTEIRGTLDLSDSQISSCAIARIVGAVSPPSDNDGGIEAGLNHDETAISLVDAKINRVVMPGREDHRPRGIVVLSRAHVGAYLDFAAAWPPELESRAHALDGRDIDHLVLDGFCYDQMSNPSGTQSALGVHSRADDRVSKRRMIWLSGQEACDIRDHFKPQPWVQLGQRLAAQGYHDDARKLSITRQRMALSAHSTSVAQRWQGRILDLFALFGHNPWRTLAWMAFFIVMFAGVWSWASGACTAPGCFDEGVFVVTNRDAYTPRALDTPGAVGATYPPFHALGYSFDVFVPFISFGYADHWRPNLNWGPILEFRLPGLAGDQARVETGAPPDLDETVESGDGAGGVVVRVTRGGLLYVLVIVEMLIGLALTSLAITGFTGLLRSD